ncbi:PD-(D/E)XK nuclease family protein [Desulfovermiculus halophilus]|uniref:PD-(D/E)XK nuclease family protein n=1 Tax=Desulfovermiculus halophilus TaxID=339722 RepID=UPI0013781811|nr:PD-(D/E)XK nuclease family protein [Desulfovermiculus halophilus]
MKSAGPRVYTPVMHDFVPIPETELLPALARGATLITVNRRLSRSILHRYHSRTQNQGETVWETPDVLPWNAWLTRCLHRATYLHPDGEHPLPLSQDQELALWETVIRGSQQAKGLLHLSHTAGQVAQAWVLYQHWDMEKHDDPLLWTSPDHEAFLEWSRAFRTQVDTRGWLEAARQPAHVAQLLDSGILPAPQSIILAGFEQVSPIQKHLAAVLQDQACALYQLQFSSRESEISAFSLPDRRQEIQSAANWARSHLLTDPAQRIGIIVPDLSQIRDRVELSFDAVLHPDAAVDPAPPRQRSYDLSLGRPLSAYPLVQAALNILNLTRDPLPLSTASAVLTSSFISGGAAETGLRAEYEAALRSMGETEVRWSPFLRQAREPQMRGLTPCPLLARALESFQETWRELPASQPPSAWAQDIDRLVHSMGWPGEQSLDSREYQTVQAFHSCLRRLAGLDPVLPRISLNQAIARLEHIASQTVFQPEGPEARVRIMGILEAVGEHFDHLWIMGLTDQIWPPAPEPNPFLPASVQRDLGMPRSSPERELDYARNVLDRLTHSSPDVVLSCPEREEDRELLPSPLLRDLPVRLEHCEPETLCSPWEDRDQTLLVETFSDESGPPLPPPYRAPGGSGLLRSQAACPFQGFARHRLQAEALDQPTPGLGPVERGSIVHLALEKLWAQCPDQAFLLTLDQNACTELIGSAVDRAVREMRGKRPLSLSKEYAVLERRRLMDLLAEWLDLERRRSPFQVHSLEKRLDVSIGGLQLNVAADRIDRLDNGKLVVIDYKTGRHTMSEWFQDRPVEPQVPLYSLFCPDPVAGVYFGVVRKGESCFVGLGEEADIVPGCKAFDQHASLREFTSWTGLLDHWKTRLEDLAAEVLRGHARAEPSTRQTCTRCDLHPLCRIFDLHETPNR